MAATIKDVAKRAGVGIATVSRVINASPNVLPRTRERVLAAVEELGYRPNQAARQLVTARTNTIGVVLPFLTRPFFVEVLRGIEAEIATSEFQLIIFNVETVEQRNQYFGHLPFLGRLDGLIIVSLPLGQSEIQRIQKVGLPVVIADHGIAELPSVTVDNIAGASMAVEHLIIQGHKRIAYLSGPIYPLLGLKVNQDRLKGYEQAMRKFSLPIRSEYIYEVGDGRNEGRCGMQHLLALSEPPTAVFTSSDELAFGALDTLQAQGLTPGQDIGLIGFDDLELAEYLQLSTVKQPMEQMGRMAAKTLLHRLKQEEEGPLTTVLPLELCLRASTTKRSQ